RIGCSIAIELIKSDLPFDAWFSFSVQEEVGLRGAKVSAYNINPDFAIALEATTACDIADTAESKSVCCLNKGAVVSFMDGSTMYEKPLFDAAFKVAEEKKANIQVKRGTTGGNDAGAIHLTRDGVRTLTLSVPCRYLHSAECVIDKRDVESAKEIALGVFELMASDKL
ncbi:MAG: M42 family peptidase, partial [Acutalibacteraceae bacterium]|nr:M42 family peptidase [Acutalibacteraceae bacterium]